jgi:hypothetical protein
MRNLPGHDARQQARHEDEERKEGQKAPEQLKVGTKEEREDQAKFPEPDPSPLDPNDPPPNNPPLHSDLMAQKAELEEAEREAALAAQEVAKEQAKADRDK